MKKILLAAALFAAASFNSFGAACVTSTIAELQALGSCEINGWTLDTWSLGQASSNGYTPNLNAGTPTFNQSAVLVSFQSLTNGSQLGFAVTFSDSQEAGSFFNASVGQSVNWNSNFSVVGTPIVNVTLGVTGASVNSPIIGNEGGNGQVNVQKIVYDPLVPVFPFLGVNNILTVDGFQSSNPVTVANMPNNQLTRISVADVYQLNGGSTGTGSFLTSYTNTFWAAAPPDTGVPEPMTFVLMGAGLVGIAALRRRR
jgi:hypothetical protein